MHDESNQSQPINADEGSTDNQELHRNLLSFWINGLCNNFGYVVMLSAAFDILNEQTKDDNVKPT